ncbi:hypothetical protein [Spiroplasma endosymbiont of Stenodema calcarata]|uniref:hypothetical protein n=1 Tax=Spiroplasma endosymbiont of Stenodema calcarata TaxID=3139328 RepID=UPI003CCAB094
MKDYLTQTSYHYWFNWSVYNISFAELRPLEKPDGFRFSDVSKLILINFKTWLNKNEKSMEDFDLFSVGLLNGQDQLWYNNKKLIPEHNPGLIYYDIGKTNYFGFWFGTNSQNSIKFNFFDKDKMNGIHINT